MSTFKEFLEYAKYEKGYIIVSLTDEYIIDNWEIIDYKTLEEKQKKILEIRLFNKQKEIKLFRSDVSKEFYMRILDDTTVTRDYIEESQYLDIDTERSKGQEIITTGGGKYHLPFVPEKDQKITIRYYLERYAESGQARVADWRVVAFEGVD